MIPANVRSITLQILIYMLYQIKGRSIFYRMEMDMSNKQFSERLNKELDDIGVPQRNDERIEIVAKLLKVPRFKAESILSGNTSPDTPLLDLLTQELEVSADWLLGKSEDRH